MTLRLHDTATRAMREFVPLEAGRVSIYVCGATVQAAPHVGHIRSGVSFDVLNRWLRASGYRVTYVRNVTDIDDKILAKAELEGRPWWAVAADYERAFVDAYRILGCLPPTVEPRATGHVPAMVELMQRLIAAGHAYPAAGDVYFDTASWPAYGELSRQKMRDIQPAEDADPHARKRDPRDFALWKGTSDAGPAWQTPWGPGRPGWHLECSAMARTYLGPRFDIHGGGLDLIFPHHENEIAQSRAAGDPFANYWLHNAWVTTSGEKMSKSLGNSLLVTDVVKRVRPVELRFYLASAHYRSHLEFSDEALADAAAGYRRLEGFVRRAAARVGPDPSDEVLTEEFLLTGARDASAEHGPERLLAAGFQAAMDDDLGVPAALAAVFDTVTEGNKLLTRAGYGVDHDLALLLRQVRNMLAVLGVDPLAEPWVAAEVGGAHQVALSALDALISQQLQARATARANRDFAAADGIRTQLSALGIAITDTPEGSRWGLGETA
ncbi:MAG: cysteine--tRNA ligase [Candidatus Nanopelagicales bacterium]